MSRPPPTLLPLNDRRITRAVLVRVLERLRQGSIVFLETLERPALEGMAAACFPHGFPVQLLPTSHANYLDWQRTHPVNRLVAPVSGPVRVQRWRGLGKVVYNLADEHTRRGACSPEKHAGAVSVEQLLHHLLMTTPYVIDLVVEDTPYDSDDEDEDAATATMRRPLPEVERMRPRADKQARREDNYLDLVRAAFAPCLEPAKRTPQCVLQYPRVRFHANDRRLEHFGPWVRLVLLLRRRALQEEEEGRRRHGVRLASAEIKRGLQGMRRDVAAWDRLLRDLFKVDKQLRHCADRRVVAAINGWLAHAVRTRPLTNVRGSAMVDVVATVNGWIDAGCPPPYPVVELEALIIAALGLYMDAYTVARMFRTFRAPPDRPGEYATEMRNVVLYTGAFHAQNYAEMLALIGLRLEVDIGTDWGKEAGDPVVASTTHPPRHYQCLDLRPLLPFQLEATPSPF